MIEFKLPSLGADMEDGTLLEWRVKPGDALMVGDSVSDVKAARAAGFAIVCMSYGYNHGVDVRTANPDAVLDSLIEIRGVLEQAT